MIRHKSGKAQTFFSISLHVDFCCFFFDRNGSVNVMLMFLMTKGILGDLLTALNKSHSEKGIEFPMSLSNIFSKESRSRAHSLYNRCFPRY